MSSNYDPSQGPSGQQSFPSQRDYGTEQGQTVNHKDAKANAKASKAYAKATRPWYKKKRFWLLGLIALIVIISVVSKGGSSSDDKSSSTSTSQPSGSDKKASAPSNDPTDKLTDSQKNARRSAESYLSAMPFSKAGLIQQLSSDAGDKYSVADATAAVNTLDTNWNEQAVKAAKNYLDTMPMSCAGLKQQLSSQAGDKFTAAEAAYGAGQMSVCK